MRCAFILFLINLYIYVSCSLENIHVAYASTSTHLPGLMASIKSIVTHTQQPFRVIIHVVQFAHDVLPLSNFVGFIEQVGAKLHLHTCHRDDVAPYLNHNLRAKMSRLREPANYARYILWKLLGDISICLYLDTDVLVRKDLVIFMERYSTSKYLLGAFPRDWRPIRSSTFTKLKELGVNVANSLPSFNAGVLVLNLTMWRTVNADKAIREVSLLNTKYKLWDAYGSQPALLVMFGGERFHHLNSSLFVNNARGMKEEEIPCNAVFLHWNGITKPWNEVSHSSLEMKYWS